MTTEEVKLAIEDESSELHPVEPDSAQVLSGGVPLTKQKAGNDVDHNIPYLFKRMGRINREDWSLYVRGLCASIGKPR